MKRAESTQKFIDYTAGYFEKMKAFGNISIPDVKICSIAFIGTIYNVIMEWLQNSSQSSLTDSAYGLIICKL